MSGSDRTPQQAGLLEPGVSGNLRRSCARRLAQRQRAANLATIRAAVIAALKDAGYLHIPEGRRDDITPAETLRLQASIRTEADIHGTRRSLEVDWSRS